LSKPWAWVLVFLAGASATAQQTASELPPLTIANIFREGGLLGRAPEQVQWSPDGKKVSYIIRDDSGEHAELWWLDVATGKPAVLVSEQKLQTLQPPVANAKDERKTERRHTMGGYYWSPDSEHLLFDADGQLWLYALDTKTAVNVSSSAGDPKFSPDGKRLAYIRDHNVFVNDLKSHEEQLTEGKEGRRHVHVSVSFRDDNKGEAKPEDLLNGEVDWVYAEELDVTSNYFWSPDSAQIAFLQMDESSVPQYPIEDFIPAHATIDEQKYPKAGDPNPAVRVGVVKAGGGGTRWIAIGDDKDIYVPRFGWVQPGLLYVEVLNRAQNKLDLYFADANSGRSRVVLTESSPSWIYPIPEPRFLQSADQFLWQSWRDGHTHIYLYRFNKQSAWGDAAAVVRQVTHGDFETGDVAGLDEAAGTVYFTSNAASPIEQQLYAVKLSGGDPVAIAATSGTHSVTFPAQGAQYFIDAFSSFDSPPSLSVCKVGGACASFWRGPSPAGYNLAAPRVLQLKAADGTTTLYGTLLLPSAEAVAGNGGKVPLLTNPYGGPGIQSVTNSWGDGEGNFFNQILARDGIAVLTVDNRGQGGRSRDFQSAMLHHMGELPFQDQMAALDQVFQQFPQLDRNRLGWWGWSYGGYLTLYAMTHTDRIRAGVAVAPVTDWHNYDTIYTERYLGLPAQNEEEYRRTSPVNFAAALKGHLLEVHGTSDDNVHMQNTIQMTNAFIAAGRRFDLMLYPRKTHSIAGQAARTDLFTRIEELFKAELLGKSSSAPEEK